MFVGVSVFLVLSERGTDTVNGPTMLIWAINPTNSVIP